MTVVGAALKSNSLKKNKNSILKRILKYKVVYLFLLPSFLCILVFSYIPMTGILIAFQEFSISKGFKGIFTSQFVGLQQFKSLFASFYFYTVFRNTLVISILKLIFVFPAPIILAILLNELKSNRFKRIVQTVTYLPNFLSIVVISGLVAALFSPTYGIVNSFRTALGLDVIHYIGDQNYFRSIIVGIDVWQSAGVGAIIYLAAMASINPELYEAAIIDGASRFRQIIHITLPEITDLIILLFIFRIGNIMNAGFDSIFLLYSPPVYEVGDIIDTFVYREGLLKGSYSFTTAVGVFKSLIGLVLILTTNKVAKRFGRQGIW